MPSDEPTNKPADFAANARYVVGNVLMAEDQAAVGRALSRALASAGFEVTVAADGKAALDALAQKQFDAIVSDINMPGLSGIELLRAVRERDGEVPVILMTGAPDFTTAVQAVEYGAMRYLEKPVDLAMLRQTVSHAVKLHAIAKLKREAFALSTQGGLGASDRAALEASFARAMDGLWMAYQPIVRSKDGSVFGYEALMRSVEPALPNPLAVLDAAERLDKLTELGRKLRLAAAVPIVAAPDRGAVFINLHARDLLDETLASPMNPLAGIAKRVVLEITERASLDEVKDARARVTALRRMGYRIAIDDLGAGYAGLTSFATLEPEFVKLDMSLVRGVDANVTKQKLVRSMTSLCADMGMTVVAEGVETLAERETLIALGCDLLQGYLLAKPGRPFPDVSW